MIGSQAIVTAQPEHFLQIARHEAGAFPLILAHLGRGALHGLLDREPDRQPPRFVARGMDLAGRQVLVAEEQTLRQELQHGEISESEEHQRLRRVETELDQCWDLLRQRRALRETGGDPGEAAVRPADEVEGYLG